MKSILLFLLIPIFVFGQDDFSLNQGRISPNKYFQELPFEFLKGQIIITVSINGDNYRFSLDTGAPTSISDELYKTLNPSNIGTIEVSDANNEKDSLKVAILKSIKLGDIEIKEAPTLVVNSENLIYKCIELDGNIGSNSLRNSVVQFDYLNKKVRISNSTKPLNLDRKFSQKMELTSNQSSPLLWVKLDQNDKVKLQVLFDSGMEGLFDMSLRYFSNLIKYDLFTNVKSVTGNHSMGLHGNTTDTLHSQFQIKQLKFSQLKLENATSYTTKSPNSRVETKVLEFAIVTLDYKKERIYFSPIGSQVQNASIPTFPIQPNYKDGKYQIGFIWYPEKVPNINIGDEILSVNDISCQDKSICELFLLLTNSDNQKLNLVTKDKNGIEYKSTIIKE